MAILRDTIDWVVSILVLLGVPTVTGKYVLDRRRIKAGGMKAEVEADFEEAVLPDRVRSSSVVTQEAERIALTKSFEADRAIRDNTLDHVRAELANERSVSAQLRVLLAEKDIKISELQETVESMQSRLVDLSNEVARFALELEGLRDDATPTH